MGLFDFPNFKFTNSEPIYIEPLFACAKSLVPEDVTQWFMHVLQCFLLFVLYDLYILALTISLFYITVQMHSYGNVAYMRKRTMQLFTLKARGHMMYAAIVSQQFYFWQGKEALRKHSDTHMKLKLLRHPDKLLFRNFSR